MKHLTAFFGALLMTGLALVAPVVSAAEKQDVVNINEASATQLAFLPRVGPALSARIVEFREQNGKFKDVGDLMLVRGIGEKTYALMRPFLTVSGETTLAEKVRASQVPTPVEPADEESPD